MYGVIHLQSWPCQEVLATMTCPGGSPRLGKWHDTCCRHVRKKAPWECPRVPVSARMLAAKLNRSISAAGSDDACWSSCLSHVNACRLSDRQACCWLSCTPSCVTCDIGAICVTVVTAQLCPLGPGLSRCTDFTSDVCAGSTHEEQCSVRQALLVMWKCSSRVCRYGVQATLHQMLRHQQLCKQPGCLGKAP